MTEAEWVAATEPAVLFGYGRNHFSDRKLRLFACEACYRVWDYLTPTCQEALSVLVQYADGLADKDELSGAQNRAVESLRCAEDEAVYFATDADTWMAAREAIYGVAGKEIIWGWPGRNETNVVEQYRELAIAADLLRDIFGNPFRPVTFSPAWRTDTAVALAQQMYDAREFHAMPILADALQDAGCDNPDVLNHCRESGPHVRGCWVVDLVLGKE